jgi:hypothetical protein
MSNIIAKIDVTKIDKKYLFPGKNGAKWLDIILWENDEPDKYGNNYVAVQGISKEARDSGEKGYILGNGKKMERREQRTAKSNPRSSRNAHQEEEKDDDIPF